MTKKSISIKGTNRRRMLGKKRERGGTRDCAAELTEGEHYQGHRNVRKREGRKALIWQ